MRCIEFKTNRSAFKIDCELPVTKKTTSPMLILLPSVKMVSIFKSLSIAKNIIFANSTPAIIPFSFTKSLAFPFVFFGIQAKELWSPSPISSRIPFLIMSCNSVSNCSLLIMPFILLTQK